MEENPLKRRKTRASGSASMSSQASHAPSAASNDNTQPITPSSSVPLPPTHTGSATWPQGKIPLEIYNMIMSFLPRSDLQRARLVNKEFDRMVSSILFNVVVVPFRPEIYGVIPEKTESGEEAGRSSIMIHDKGMQIFNGFGRYIRKFAMSFEIDYKRLTKPPIKSNHEAIFTFWGIYKWPHKIYNRYSQLEGLEQTADETRSMAKALKFVNEATELGLSIDGGLGWLSGPDTNAQGAERYEKPKVFGATRFPPEPEQDINHLVQVAAEGTTTESMDSPQRPIQDTMRQILEEAGVHGDRLQGSVDLMLELEGVTTVQSVPRRSSIQLPLQSSEGTPSTPSTPSTHSPPPPPSRNIALALGAPGSRRRRSQQTASTGRSTGPITRARGANIAAAINNAGPLAMVRGASIINAGPVAPARSAVSSEDDDANGDDDNGDDRNSQARITQQSLRSRPGIRATNFETSQEKQLKCDPYPLKPNDLTNAQREMLLEMEWAQNAFMQSWALAIMDSRDTFNKITLLNIARIPSCHLAVLRRDDFWESLPALSNLSLGVIPNWRQVRKEATAWVSDTPVRPSVAVTEVFTLLGQQISRRTEIKSLHFEWIGGGEYAPGMFDRNQHVMAAPFVLRSIHMLNRDEGDYPILELPHIEHLSLKNCWFSPHILFRTLTSLRDSGLKSIKFDSVSLTAPLFHNAHPLPAPLQLVIPNGNQLAQVNNAQLQAMFQTHVQNLQANGQHPPTFAQFAQQFAQGGLPPLQNGNAAPVNLPPNWVGGANGPAVPLAQLQPPPVAGSQTNSNINGTAPSWLDENRPPCWTSLIDGFTPGNRLCDIRHQYYSGPDPTRKETTSLFKLEFISCGYLRLPFDFDQSTLECPQIIQTLSNRKKHSDIEPMMQNPYDNCLGYIVNHIPDLEKAALENAWRFVVGNRDSRTQLVAEAQLDGYPNAFLGRFDGLIEVQPDLLGQDDE